MNDQPELHTAVVLFDGVCNLCNESVNFIIDRDPEGYFKFASLQSNEANRYIETCPFAPKPGQESTGDAMSDLLQSIILVENGRCYRRSTAALRIARKLKGGWSLLYAGILIPAPLRDVVYNWIARNRYQWFGKLDACRLPSPELRSRFLDQEEAVAF